MRKILLVIVLCSMSIFAIQAQKAGIVFSSDKTPQVDGIAKLKILKNGNTASFEMIEDVGMLCKLYDTNNKKVGEVATPLIDKIGKYRLRAVYEINSDLMVMIGYYDKSIPTLRRYLYDGSTGKLKSEEKILEMPELTGTPKLRTNIGSYAMSDFIVTKDPLSDNYAVALCDIFAKDLNKQVEIVHYSSNHEQLNRAFFITPGSSFKNNMVCDMHVNGTESVLLATYVCNSTNTKNDDGYYYLSKLSKGTTDMKSKVLSQTPVFSTFVDRDCKLIFNKISGNVESVMRIANRDYCYMYCDEYVKQIVSPKTMEFGKKTEIKLEKVGVYYDQNIKFIKDFHPMIHHSIIDQKGNDIYLAQPTRVIYLSSGVSKADTESSTKSYCHDLTVTYVTQDGNEKYGSVIPYANTHLSPQTSSMYMDAKKGQALFTNTDEFFGSYVDVITGKVANYLLFNNIPENFEKSVGDKITPIWMNTPFFTSYVYSYDADGTLKKEYLFGKPTSEKDAKYALFNTGDYNSETGMYATQVVEIVNGKKIVSIAWMNFN